MSLPSGKRRAGPTTRARAALAAASGEAPDGDRAAPSAQPVLPEPLVLHVLSFLPPALRAWAAKLVCKAARERFRGARRVSLSCPELPLAAVQEAWRELQGVMEWLLAEARAACGDLAGLAWLRRAGCEMGMVVCAAARAGQIAVLEWARDQGLDLRDVCEAAAEGGQIAVLRWARAQAPPLPGATTLRPDPRDHGRVAFAPGGAMSLPEGKRRAGPTTRARAAAAAAAGEAPDGDRAAPSPWTGLPEPLVLHALSLWPPALQAWSAKLVCKAARERFRGATVVSLRCPELPLAAVQQAWRAAQDDGWEQQVQQQQLAEARAACGDLAGLAWLRGAGCSMYGVGSGAARAGQLAVLA
ncbi:hypothetical protein HT031_003968 [Scenedesmus sp. PABB004]|nr:hypothetical protein HT031_003968 [Scenedesmus sp. PABB004]